MSNQEYKCVECGKPAILAGEYETFASSYGCTGTDYRYYCKDCLFEIFNIHTHHSTKCSCCGKDLSTAKEFYSFWDDELYCSIECLARKARGIELISDME